MFLSIKYTDWHTHTHAVSPRDLSVLISSAICETDKIGTLNFWRRSYFCLFFLNSCFVYRLEVVTPAISAVKPTNPSFLFHTPGSFSSSVWILNFLSLVLSWFRELSFPSLSSWSPIPCSGFFFSVLFSGYAPCCPPLLWSFSPTDSLFTPRQPPATPALYR